MTPPKEQLALLEHLYAWHRKWLHGSVFACRKGCDTCCTSSVTMTTLEGCRLLAHLQATGRAGLLDRLAAMEPAPGYRPGVTTNMLAAACLDGREVTGEEGQWDFTPCPFLEAGECSVYEARPFMCRSLHSSQPCRQTGFADMEPLQVSMSTLFLQLSEHLDQSGRWGNMLAVLPFLAGKRDPAGLLPCRPCPGFLVPPEEGPQVAEFLGRLLASNVGCRSLADWCGLPLPPGS